MVDDFEEQAPQQFDIGRYTGIIRRRYLPFLIALLLGWLLVWGASWLLPARFKSSTLILVEQPTMPKDYVTPNVSNNLQDRLQSITQQIMSRDRLLLIINKMHLYEGERVLTPDQKVALMRKDIDVELVRDPTSQTIRAFHVSYSASSPQVAQSVAGALTSLFINDNQQTLQQESEGTTKFLQEQLAAASASLAKQEADIQAFQSQHQGELPSEQASNMQILSGLQSQLQSEQDALNTARQQRTYFESLIGQYRTLEAASADPGGSPTGLALMDAQIAKMKSQLADLSTRYTDRYPAVQQLKQQIAQEEHTRRQAAAALDSQARTAKHTSSPAIPSVAAGATGALLLQLESQAKANQTDLANRERAVKALEARIGSYQTRLNAGPASAQQLADLTRGYTQSQANYDALLKKESDSEMATSMEQMQQGQRFRVLDPPNLPIKADFPNRLKFSAVGVVVGLVFAVVFGGGLELLDDRLHSDKEIEKLLPVAVISEVPEVSEPTRQRRRLIQAGFAWVFAAVVFLVIIAGSVYSYLHA